MNDNSDTNTEQTMTRSGFFSVVTPGGCRFLAALGMTNYLITMEIPRLARNDNLFEVMRGRLKLRDAG